MAFDYDWVSIGGGTAGMVSAGLAASFAAKAAIIESGRPGGSCAWYGCVPSKSLIQLAGRAHLAATGAEYGIQCGAPVIDFARVMEQVRGVSEQVYRDMVIPGMAMLKVPIEAGKARFVDPHTLEITAPDGAVKRVTCRYILIGTGSKARVPPIPGLAEVPYLTNNTLFALSQQPRRLLILGAGPIGMEMGQAFHRLGTHVHVLDHSERILKHDDAEHAEMLLRWLREEGLEITLRANVRQVERKGDGVVIRVDCAGNEQLVEGDALLVAAGRVPVVDGLGLEAAGVAYEPTGIPVDSHCRTNVRHIFAAGDVIGKMLFTHMAENMAKAAVMTALLKVPTPVDAAGLTWCTFTRPEIGQLGETQEQLDRRGSSYEVHRFPFAMIDRALTDFEPRGQIKVLATKWRGKILGVSIIGKSAGDLLGDWALARRNRLRMRHMSDTIYPYPTLAFGNRRAADQWYIRRWPLGLIRFLRWLFGYQGEVLDIGKDGTPV